MKRFYLAPKLGLELNRRTIPQGGVQSPLIIDAFDEAADVTPGLDYNIIKVES
jgi:hypothetical protein